MAEKRFYAVSYRRRDGRKATLAKRDSLGRERRYYPRHCVQCGAVYFASRKDAQTCSNACRQALYRARKRAARIRHLQKLVQHQDKLTKEGLF